MLLHEVCFKRRILHASTESSCKQLKLCAGKAGHLKQLGWTLLKPRTDEQFFLDKFSLTRFYCSCVRGKIDKFSLTRSLV